MDTIIEVEHVHKKYSRNAHTHLDYGLRDLCNHLIGRAPSPTLRKDEFFAVHDVSFSLERGDTLALIGRNGSGKSTLLKMIGGLATLDAGRIAVGGSVRMLINLAAGFNPTLSGLDNIYNSAALHGFTRRETRTVVDAIIDFAELEEFIGSPVESYSSGMKARLGFAIAAHLNPEILLIDEILAVGDHAFQNKCHARLELLKKDGVTIIFVSHSQSAVMKLCRQALWLHKGRAMAHGPARDTLQAYNGFIEAQEKERMKARGVIPAQSSSTDAPCAPPTQSPPSAVRDSIYGPVHSDREFVDDISCVLMVDGQETDVVPLHGSVAVHIRFRLKRTVAHLFSTLNFYRKDGVLAAAIASSQDDRFANVHSGCVSYEVQIPDFDLCPGHYVIMMPIADGQEYLWRDIVKEFYVESGGRVCFGMKEFRHSHTVSAAEQPPSHATGDNL